MMSNINNVANTQLANGLGAGKVLFVDVTTVKTPVTVGHKFCKFTILTATVFAELEGNMAGFVGKTIPAGTELYGRITKFRLTSGSLIAYEGA